MKIKNVSVSVSIRTLDDERYPAVCKPWLTLSFDVDGEEEKIRQIDVVGEAYAKDDWLQDSYKKIYERSFVEELMPSAFSFSAREFDLGELRRAGTVTYGRFQLWIKATGKSESDTHLVELYIDEHENIVGAAGAPVTVNIGCGTVKNTFGGNPQAESSSRAGNGRKDGVGSTNPANNDGVGSTNPANGSVVIVVNGVSRHG